MNKNDLIDSISSKAGLTKRKSEEVINAFVKSVEESLKKGEKVVLSDFGVFEVKKRAARRGRNLITKKEMVIPETKIPVFRAGKGLKNLVKK